MDRRLHLRGPIPGSRSSFPADDQGAHVRADWEYRFCWLRAAAFSLQALVGAGYTDEARAWRHWLLRAVAGDPGDLQFMYSLTGRRRVPEHELPWLGGYEGSRPVRVGNPAVGQFPLDVWGEVLNALHHARGAGLSHGTSNATWWSSWNRRGSGPTALSGRVEGRHATSCTRR